MTNLDAYKYYVALYKAYMIDDSKTEKECNTVYRMMIAAHKALESEIANAISDPGVDFSQI